MPRARQDLAGPPVFVFDFGGVVIKWRNNSPIFDSIADRYGVPRGKMREALADSLPRLEADEVSIRDYLEEALGAFGKRLRKGDSPDELWVEPFERLVKFRLGTVRVVESLRRRGFRVYLFSNTSIPHAAFVRRMGWDKMFDGFATSCEIRIMKPKAEAFRRALAQFKADKSRVVYVDDRADNVEGAKKFGIKWAFRFTTVAQLRKDLAPFARTS